VPDVKRKAALLLGAAAGAVAAFVIRRRRQVGLEIEPAMAPEPDPRAEELRRRLAEARAAATDQDELGGREPVTPDEAPPADEFEAMRRRVHAEARAAADAMRRSGDDV